MRSKTWSVAALMLALVGCAEANPGIEIEGILAEPPATEMGCSYSVDANAAFLLESRLDTSGLNGRVPIRYLAVLQVANRMLNLGNSTWPVMADPNAFYAREAEIELRQIDGSEIPGLVAADLPARYRVPISGFVPSGASETEIGLGVVTVEAIPPTYGAALRGANATIVAAIQIRGRTGGDSEQTSAELQFPIRLCDGCLYACLLDEEGEIIERPRCHPGQDAVTSGREICALLAAPPP